MKFPIIISDQQELNRLITQIAQSTADKTAEAVLLRFGKISEWMKSSECKRLSSVRKIDKALNTGKLPYVQKGRNKMIRRSDFNKFQQENEF